MQLIVVVQDLTKTSDYSSTKSWHIFTGNEMGALLGWWLLEHYCKRVNHMPESEVYIMASIVSSKMLRAIVKGRGEFVETLTGFKWMGEATFPILILRPLRIADCKVGCYQAGGVMIIWREAGGSWLRVSEGYPE